MTLRYDEAAALLILLCRCQTQNSLPGDLLARHKMGGGEAGSRLTRIMIFSDVSPCLRLFPIKRVLGVSRNGPTSKDIEQFEQP